MKYHTLKQAWMPLGVLAVLAPPAIAQDQAAELAQLRDRVAQLETSAGNRLRFNLGAGTTMTVYGYIKADFVYDFDTNLGLTSGGLGGLVAGGNTGPNFRAHSFQSRLGVRTETDTEIGVVKTVIEGDFFGGGGGTFRLRHANVSFGNWLVGRSWTNFMPIESYPGTLDFQGPTGIPFARQTQLRYTASLGDAVKASFSIENAAGASNDPTLTAAASYKTGRAFFKLAALGGTVNYNGSSYDRWGVNLSANAALWEGGKINASYTIGEGIASYMVSGGPDGQTIGGVDSLIESQALTIGLTQAITEKISFGVAYGIRQNDAPALLATDTLQTLHASVFWHPTERMTVGAEVIWGERELGNGSTENATRLQTSVQFNF